jgi:hypothetical protein
VRNPRCITFIQRRMRVFRPTCVISRISSSSPRNSTSFWLLVSGQKRSSARSTGSASVGSFSTNCRAAARDLLSQVPASHSRVQH